MEQFKISKFIDRGKSVFSHPFNTINLQNGWRWSERNKNFNPWPLSNFEFFDSQKGRPTFFMAKKKFALLFSQDYVAHHETGFFFLHFSFIIIFILCTII
jgi:hypothetical protein